MITNSKLSIIVPIYNGERHIENTIRNILSSSCQNLELLLVDDGSTDGSPVLCRKMAESEYLLTEARLPCAAAVGRKETVEELCLRNIQMTYLTAII